MSRRTLRPGSFSLGWTAVRLTCLRDGDSKDFIVEDGKIGRGNFQIHFVDAGRFIAEEIDERRRIGKHPVLGYP